MFVETEKKELSVRKYRKQESIESSLLFDTLNEVSVKIGQQKVLGVVCKPYGDLYFDFGNGTIIEFINDSQLEDFELYRLFKEHGEQYIAKIKGGKVEFYRS